MAGDRRMDRYALARRVLTLLEEDLAADGFEVLDVRVYLGGGRYQVRIYVDTAEGIDLSGCARASRTAGMLLEEADPFPGPYVIEVSSPGVRRPPEDRPPGPQPLPEGAPQSTSGSGSLEPQTREQACRDTP